MKMLGKGCLMLVVGVIVLGVLAVVFGGGTRNQPATVASSAPTSVPISGEAVATNAPITGEAVATSAPAAFTVGDDVQVGEVRWKILDAVDAGQTLKSDNQFIPEVTTSGRFVRVRFELENLSKDMLSFSGIDLQDDQGRTFTRASNALAFVPQQEQCVFENVNPNIAKACTLIFEVPQNAAKLQANVGDLKIIGSQTALIDLGLE